MTLQQLLSPTRRAIDDYKMIEEGDKIAIGLSGGKDSMSLLYILSSLKHFYPKNFELIAITVDMGFEDTDARVIDTIRAQCEKLDVPYFVEKTAIARILFDLRKESNPCSLCSKLRRGAINNVAKREGCNKLALGHHADDLIETFMLSLFYEGRLSTFQPVTELTRSEITVIRPLIYVKEKNIAAFMRDKPVLKNACPADKHTKRQFVKNMLKGLQDEIPYVKERMLGAIVHPERNNLFPLCGELKDLPDKADETDACVRNDSANTNVDNTSVDNASVNESVNSIDK